MAPNRFDLWLLVRRDAGLSVDRRLVLQPTFDSSGRCDGARDAETGDWLEVDPAEVRALEPLSEAQAVGAAPCLGAAA